MIWHASTMHSMHIMHVIPHINQVVYDASSACIAHSQLHTFYVVPIDPRVASLPLQGLLRHLLAMLQRHAPATRHWCSMI